MHRVCREESPKCFEWLIICFSATSKDLPPVYSGKICPSSDRWRAFSRRWSCNIPWTMSSGIGTVPCIGMKMYITQEYCPENKWVGTSQFVSINGKKQKENACYCQPIDLRFSWLIINAVPCYLQHECDNCLSRDSCIYVYVYVNMPNCFHPRSNDVFQSNLKSGGFPPWIPTVFFCVHYYYWCMGPIHGIGGAYHCVRLNSGWWACSNITSQLVFEPKPCELCPETQAPRQPVVGRIQ